MICNKCGAWIEDDSVFCSECGSKIEKIKPVIDNGTKEMYPKTVAWVPPDTEYIKEHQIQEPDVQQHFVQEPVEHQGRQKNKWPKLPIVIVAAAVILGGSFCAYKAMHTNDEDKTVTTISSDLSVSESSASSETKQPESKQRETLIDEVADNELITETKQTEAAETQTLPETQTHTETQMTDIQKKVQAIFDDTAQCDHSGHMAMTCDEYLTGYQKTLSANQYDTEPKIPDELSIYLSNKSSYKYYNAGIYLRSKNSGLISVDFDAKSGRIHKISILESNKDTMNELKTELCKLLGLSDAETREILDASAKADDYKSVTVGNISLSKSENWCLFESTGNEDGPVAAQQNCLQWIDDMITEGKCTQPHFDLTYTAYMEQAREPLKEYGVDYSDEKLKSQLYTSGNSGTAEIEAEQMNATPGYHVYFDQKTEQLHKIQFFHTETEIIEELIQFNLEILDVSDSDIQKVLADFRNHCKGDGKTQHLTVGTYVVSLYRGNGTYSITIEKQG